MGNPASEGTPLSVGGEIRRLRQEAGWREEDLAAALKISVRQLRALEEGNWSELPTAVFVLGVLRGVARIFSVDVEPWHRVARKALSRQPLNLEPPLTASGEEVYIHLRWWQRPLGRVLAGLSLGAALVAGYLHWFGWWPGSEPGEFGEEHASKAAEQQPSSLLAPQEEPQTGAASSFSTEAAGGAFAGGSSASEPAVLPGLPAASVSSGKSEAAEPQAFQPPSAASASSETKAGSADESAAGSEAAPSAQGLIVRAMRGEAWMRIVAQSGKVVYEGVLRAGQERRFPQENAPYQLHIGNAAAVELLWQGSPVALPKGVVRLQVPVVSERKDP